jgi:acyl-CoA synthetase (AMP-forming)/AMP-acid ligase II
MATDARMHTPYGATECLPVATIEAQEVLGETADRTSEGAGVCVGRKFDSIEWRVVRITDEPIATIDDSEAVPAGEIGELVVRGPQASPRYVTQLAGNAKAKIADGDSFWHRMGDVGWIDDQGRFWYCGRKSQRVETSAGPMYTEIYEAVFNKHPAVRRSALVGVGPRGDQKPVMILETNWPLSSGQQGELQQILQDDRPALPEGAILVVDWPLPVDIRHNAKINREWLASWATKHFPHGTTQPPASSP